MPLAIERALVDWRRRRADERLFQRLADANDLSADDRKLLFALADRHRLVRRSEIFVRPSLFATSPDRATWPTRKLSELAQRLFGPDDVRNIGGSETKVLSPRGAPLESIASADDREAVAATPEREPAKLVHGIPLPAISPAEPAVSATPEPRAVDPRPSAPMLPSPLSQRSEPDDPPRLVREAVDDPDVDGIAPATS
ncbi:MAG: hypothetical protein KDC38_16615 [Planctomycetes bacterium]|nr:hypothetical protein [Planctomycetota bacterium]